VSDPGIITMEDLDRRTEEVRQQEQALKRTARDAEARVKEVRQELYMLVALKKSMKAKNAKRAESGA
jgi:hypothetical protein